MSNLVFNIDKKLLQVFNFVLDYTETNKSTLFLEWKENSSCQICQSQKSVDVAPIEFKVDSKDEIEFNYALRTFLKMVDKDTWIENHIRNYCAQKLLQICREFSGNNMPSVLNNENNQNPGRGVNKIPDDYWNYLVNYDNLHKKNIKNQYEIAFRCRIVPTVKEKFDLEFFKIEDLPKLIEIGDWIKANQKNNTDSSAYQNYIEYLRNNGICNVNTSVQN